MKVSEQLDQPLRSSNFGQVSGLFPWFIICPGSQYRFVIKTHDLSLPFWPCGYECCLLTMKLWVQIPTNLQVKHLFFIFSLFWWSRWYNYKTKKVAAPNDLLLELAFPAELTDTWLAHAMWSCEHTQLWNRVCEHGSHCAVATCCWIPHGPANRSIDFCLTIILVFEDRQFIWI